MRLLDLSHEITSNMPVYPGTPQPQLQPANTLEQDGFRETLLQISSHTGTHMDAPSHMLPEGQSLSDMPIDKFFGLALLVDVTHLKGKKIEASFLKAFAERLADAKFLVFKTGYQQLWGKEEYFTGYPTLTEEAAQWLGNFALNGVGTDAISLDEITTTEYPIHKILFSHNMVIVENLNQLDRLNDGISKIHGGYFLLSAMPLKYADADGSPLRAIGYDVPEMLL